MVKVAFFETEPWEVAYIQKNLASSNNVFSEEKLSEATMHLAQDADIISPFIYSSLQKQLLSKLPHLRFIATRSTGFDHIDISYCKQNNITVSNVATYGAHTVAEHTFALILSLSRKLIPSVEQARRGDFSLEGLRGFDLFGKTIGVIGMGNIGSRVVAIAQGFGIQVLVYTRSKQMPVGKGVEHVSFEDLIRRSDIVSLHVPHTKETHHLINSSNIKQFKKGSMLINTARGPLVETQAILEGLESGILSGVGLDVLEEECSLKEERELLTADFLKTCDIKTQLLNHVLLTRNDVIITPHNAFNSTEALAQILETTIANINAFQEGKPINTVT